MYQVYADDTLIFDSSDDQQVLSSAEIVKEVNKAGTFNFGILPDKIQVEFRKMKTLITTLRSDNIIFRGRVLDDDSDYYNATTITCGGELGFLQDSITRPYEFTGPPGIWLRNLIMQHNEQVDEFKKFHIGSMSAGIANVTLSNTDYSDTLDNLNRLLDQGGGFIQLVHVDNDPIPTINYVNDFAKVSDQDIKFGVNLRDFTKSRKSADFATAIIPLGAEIEHEEGEDEDIGSLQRERVTITGVNNGCDYIYDPAAVQQFGWIFKVVTWDQIENPMELKTTAQSYLKDIIKDDVTIDLSAVDLHYLDRSIDAFEIESYINIHSDPHRYHDKLLCYKQTINLLRPDADQISLGNVKNPGNPGKIKNSKKKSSISNSGGYSAIQSQVNNDVSWDISHIKNTINVNKKASSGLYKTVVGEDGGPQEIYFHDKPSLERSSIIIKLTDEGIQVTSDGGLTWFGLLVNGDMLANLISANGITIGGKEDEEGFLDLLGEDGEKIARVDAKGFHLYGKVDPDQFFHNGDSVFDYEDEEFLVKMGRGLRILQKKADTGTSYSISGANGSCSLFKDRLVFYSGQNWSGSTAGFSFYNGMLNAESDINMGNYNLKINNEDLKNIIKNLTDRIAKLEESK